jgi:hypothetical protein
MARTQNKKKDDKGLLLFAGLFGVGVVTYLMLRTRKDEPGNEGGGSGPRPNPQAPGRGLMNNNPLNLKYSSTPWAGKIPRELNTDLPYEQFDTLAHGYRAGIKNLRFYVDNLGMTSLNAIIQKWAPDSTGTYQTYVKGQMGLDPTQDYNLGGQWLYNKGNVWSLVSAMAKFENNPATSTAYIQNNKDKFTNAWNML